MVSGPLWLRCEAGIAKSVALKQNFWPERVRGCFITPAIRSLSQLKNAFPSRETNPAFWADIVHDRSINYGSCTDKTFGNCKCNAGVFCRPGLWRQSETAALWPWASPAEAARRLKFAGRRHFRFTRYRTPSSFMWKPISRWGSAGGVVSWWMASNRVRMPASCPSILRSNSAACGQVPCARRGSPADERIRA